MFALTLRLARGGIELKKEPRLIESQPVEPLETKTLTTEIFAEHHLLPPDEALTLHQTWCIEEVGERE